MCHDAPHQAFSWHLLHAALDLRKTSEHRYSLYIGRFLLNSSLDAPKLYWIVSQYLLSFDQPGLPWICSGYLCPTGYIYYYILHPVLSLTPKVSFSHTMHSSNFLQNHNSRVELCRKRSDISHFFIIMTKILEKNWKKTGLLGSCFLFH